MSTKYPSPLLGYNNNVRHKGRVFHIQTEDSGVKYGHIITHLFMDGGRILKSVKTSYAEYIGNDRMSEILREMMKQQHKAMFIALRDGKFDAIVDGGEDASQTTQSVAAESPPTIPPPPAMTDEAEGPPTVRGQPQELTLDIDALARAADAANAASPVLRASSDLPPPPPNLFREKTATGNYRITPVPPVSAVDAQAGAAPAQGPGPVAVRPPSRPIPSATTPLRRPSQAAAATAGERRYAPTRPASIFGQSRPQQGKSIFGEDLISDKSLDEVILSYLAEDLDDKK